MKLPSKLSLTNFAQAIYHFFIGLTTLFCCAFLLRLLMLDKSAAILYNQNNFDGWGGLWGLRSMWQAWA